MNARIKNGEKPFAKTQSQHLKIFGQPYKRPEFIIDRCMPTGVGFIAGASGVGKTTQLTSLACIFSGLPLIRNTITADPAALIWIAEDVQSIHRQLHTIAYVSGWSPEHIALCEKRIKLIESQRMFDGEIMDFLIEKQLQAIQRNTDLKKPPIIIFDTITANFEFDDEIGSQPMARLIVKLKNFNRRTNCPIFLIDHLTKQSNGKSTDQLPDHTPRGTQAKVDNSDFIWMLSTSADGKTRCLILGKHRTGKSHQFNIEFEATVESIPYINQFGEEDYSDEYYPVPKLVDKDNKKIIDYEYKKLKLHPLVMKLITETKEPTKTEIASKMPDKSDAFAAIKELLQAGRIIEVKFDPEHVINNRKSYLKINSQS